MKATFRLLLALSALLVVSCGHTFDRAEADEAFLRAHPDASPTEAGCVVDDLVGQFGFEGLETQLGLSKPDQAFQIAQIRAMFACGITADVETEVVRLLAESGLDNHAARCAGAALTASLDAEGLDVLLSGEITDIFYEQYFDALDGCDALP